MIDAKRVKVTVRRTLITAAEIGAAYYSTVVGLNWVNNLLKFWIWVSLISSLFCFLIFCAIAADIKNNKETSGKFQALKKVLKKDYIPNWIFMLADFSCIAILASHARWGLSIAWLATLIMQYSMRHFIFQKQEEKTVEEKDGPARMLRPVEIGTIQKVKRLFRF